MLLPHSVALQLGLFVTGCCPGGGGSNMWTLILGGNLHLSITMTCVSTIAAFGIYRYAHIHRRHELNQLIDGTVKID